MLNIVTKSQENKTIKGGKTYKNKSKTNKQKIWQWEYTLIITFKYKQIKYSNQKTQIDQKDTKSKTSMCCLG